MMAVATIIYMVVGTVRDAYFPSPETPVVSAPPPANSGPFLAGPPAATASPSTFITSFTSYSPEAAGHLTGHRLEPRPECEHTAPTAVLAESAPASSRDTTAYAVQDPVAPAPQQALPETSLLLVEGL